MTTVNQTLGQYSEAFMLLAAIAYTVAFIAFAADLVRARKLPVVSAEASAPVSVAAGPAEGVEWLHSGARPGSGGGVVEDSMAYRPLPRPAARIGVAVSLLGAAVHAAGVVTRGIAAGRVPWGNMYEFTTTGAMLVMAVFLTTLLFRDLRFLGTFVTGLALVMLMAGAIAYPTPVAQLIPALQSYWLVIHVSVAVLSAAIFTLTFCLSSLQLIKARQERNGKDTPSGLLRLVPGPVALEQLAYRLNGVGFILWTFTLMAGAIWAEASWGRYWGWDPKEVWTFVIWVIYAGYLHARSTRNWDGARAAWLSITGYLCVVFNFTVVNIYFQGLHSYSGL
jgi:cytochrome c-type biogenesis protein CcsB